MAVRWTYRWSSARAYANGEADDLLAGNRWYEELGRTPRQRQQKWRQFLLGADPREEEIRHAEAVVGDDAFRTAYGKRMGGWHREGVGSRGNGGGLSS